MKREAVISIESYLGDRVGRLKTTIQSFCFLYSIVKMSSVYEIESTANPQRGVLSDVDSERWAGGLSLAVRFVTNQQPLDVLNDLQVIERQVNMTTRCVDIDLLFFGELSLMTPQLTLPHPELHRRPQVLIPAAEVAPDYVHPVLETSLSQLSRRFESIKWGHYYSSGKTLLDFS